MNRKKSIFQIPISLNEESNFFQTPISPSEAKTITSTHSLYESDTEENKGNTYKPKRLSPSMSRNSIKSADKRNLIEKFVRHVFGTKKEDDSPWTTNERKHLKKIGLGQLKERVLSERLGGDELHRSFAFWRNSLPEEEFKALTNNVSLYRNMRTRTRAAATRTRTRKAATREAAAREAATRARKAATRARTRTRTATRTSTKTRK